MNKVHEVEQSGKHAAEELKQKGGQAAEQAQQKAQQAAGQAKGKVRQELDQRSKQAAEQVQSTAEALRKVGEELRKQDKQEPAKLMTQGAEKAEQLGRYLEESDGERILTDVEDVVRKKPWAAVAGGTAVGFALSRFVKASTSRRHQSSGGQQRSQAQGQGGAYTETAGIWEPAATPVAVPPQASPQPVPPAATAPLTRRA